MTDFLKVSCAILPPSRHHAVMSEFPTLHTTYRKRFNTEPTKPTQPPRPPSPWCRSHKPSTHPSRVRGPKWPTQIQHSTRKPHSLHSHTTHPLRPTNPQPQCPATHLPLHPRAHPPQPSETTKFPSMRTSSPTTKSNNTAVHSSPSAPAKPDAAIKKNNSQYTYPHTALVEMHSRCGSCGI